MTHGGRTRPLRVGVAAPPAPTVVHSLAKMCVMHRGEVFAQEALCKCGSGGQGPRDIHHVQGGSAPACPDLHLSSAQCGASTGCKASLRTGISPSERETEKPLSWVPTAGVIIVSPRGICNAAFPITQNQPERISRQRKGGRQGNH